MSFPVLSRGDFWQPLIAPEARKERSYQSFSASHIGPRADCPFHRPAFFRPGREHRRPRYLSRNQVILATKGSWAEVKLKGFILLLEQLDFRKLLQAK